jgi:hypothetical protein
MAGSLEVVREAASKPLTASDQILAGARARTPKGRLAAYFRACGESASSAYSQERAKVQ